MPPPAGILGTPHGLINRCCGLQTVQEQADVLGGRLADAMAEQQRAREEAAKELAAERMAWDARRRDELQVSNANS